MRLTYKYEIYTAYWDIYYSFPCPVGVSSAYLQSLTTRLTRLRVFSTDDSNHQLGASHNWYCCLFCAPCDTLAVHSLTTMHGFSILRVHYGAFLTAVVPRMKKRPGFMERMNENVFSGSILGTKNSFPQISVGQYLQKPYKIIMESTVDVGVVLNTYLMYLLPLQREHCLAGHESWSGWDGQKNRTEKEKYMAGFNFHQLLKQEPNPACCP